MVPAQLLQYYWQAETGGTATLPPARIPLPLSWPAQSGLTAQGEPTTAWRYWEGALQGCRGESQGWLEDERRAGVQRALHQEQRRQAARSRTLPHAPATASAVQPSLIRILRCEV